MTVKPLPYVAGIIRAWLAEQKAFTDCLHGGLITTRNLPDPLTKPRCLVAVTDHMGDDPLLHRVIVQVTPWAPESQVSKLREDPDVTVWRAAAMAGELLGRAKNQVLDDTTAWSASWLDGPVQLYDLKRGADRPLFYAPVRFQVHVRHRGFSKF